MCRSFTSSLAESGYTVSAVRKGVIRARFLTGVYLLQSIDTCLATNCRLCQLGVEYIHHVVTRCPAYHNIRTLTTSQLKSIIIDNSDKTHFSNWDNLLRIIFCPDAIRVMVPELSSVISSVEDLSRDCFYKIHTKRLFLMKQQE